MGWKGPNWGWRGGKGVGVGPKPQKEEAPSKSEGSHSFSIKKAHSLSRMLKIAVCVAFEKMWACRGASSCYSGQLANWRSARESSHHHLQCRGSISLPFSYFSIATLCSRANYLAYFTNLYVLALCFLQNGSYSFLRRSSLSSRHVRPWEGNNAIILKLPAYWFMGILAPIAQQCKLCLPSTRNVYFLL